VCRSTDPRDKRLRTSILIQTDEVTLTVDAGPDFRQQMLRENVTKLDAVLISHEHKDHIGGLDDLLPYIFMQKKPMTIYVADTALPELKREYSYAFDEHPYPGAPTYDIRHLDETPFDLGDLHIEPFYRDPLLCIVPKDFVKELPCEEMTISEMAKLRFVVQRESTDADIQNYMKQNHLDIQTRYHVVDDLATVVMVAAGFGICIMPELVMNDIPYDVRQYRMEPDAARIIGLAALNPQLMAPAVRTLYGHILSKYTNLD